jgi:hypothetical protein
VSGKVKIGVTSGMSGHFAVMYDDDGPINTGVGRYKTRKEAVQEARDWSRANEVPLEDSLK